MGAAPASAAPLISPNAVLAPGASGDVAGAREPICTCTEMVTPVDCDASMAAPLADARRARGEIKKECAVNWRKQCEAEHGWMQCAQVDPAQIAAQCDEMSSQWWAQVVQPQIGQARAQCEASNEGWKKQCLDVTRPEACGACDGMKSGVAEKEAKISDHLAWIEATETGSVLTQELTDEIRDRRNEIDLISRQLKNERANYQALVDTGYCPDPAS